MNTFLRIAPVMLALAAGYACAQSYPTRPVRIVIPYPPGGGTDVMGRRIAHELTPRLGQSVVVENIGGAGGNIGMRQVAQSAPDGYTLVLALTAQWAVNVSVFPKLPYDPLKDFEPVTTLAVAPYVLVTHPSLPATSTAELIALAKRMPGKLSYGSAGNGSGQHLGMELFKSMTRIDLQHVPYKGGAPAMIDAISGMVPITLQTYTSIIGPTKAGKLRALGVTTRQRVPALASVPAIAEAVPGYQSEVWYLVGVPAAAPKEIVARLNTELVQILRTPAMRQTLEADANVIVANSPAEAREFVRSEIAKWAKVVKTVGVRLD
ncbi:MAG TPA: tripartite tricarboxylate transporter substrate binding protein [Burkholderiales bacterium]|nr:tripartite tricarboxylate transporter substrate binding protein [Burkholderiales bacterium]